MTTPLRNKWEDLIPTYPSLDSDTVYPHLYRKKEFWKDSFPSSSPYFPHQLQIQRFVSHWTTYQRVLLVHEVGTGKSGVVSAVMDHFLALEIPIVYAVDNQIKVDNFQKELCLRIVPPILQSRLETAYRDGKVAPHETKRRHLLQQRVLKLSNVHLFTYHELLSESTSTSRFRDKAIVLFLDECQHLAFEESERHTTTKKKHFVALFRFLNETIHPSSKVLLLTGTPMQDRSESIACLWNLLLSPPAEKTKVAQEEAGAAGGGMRKSPVSDETEQASLQWIEEHTKRCPACGIPIQCSSVDHCGMVVCTLCETTFIYASRLILPLPLGSRFLKTYCQPAAPSSSLLPVPSSSPPESSSTTPSRVLWQWKPDKVKELAAQLRGKFSFLLQKRGEVTVEYTGERMEPYGFSAFPLVLHSMDPFQEKTYQQCMQKNDSVYNAALQSSLLVFPDGSYGSSGFSSFFIRQDKSISSPLIRNYRMNWQQWGISSSTDLQTMSYLQKLKIIAKYSVLYADCIKNLREQLFLPADQRVRRSFFYIDKIEGSGVLALGIILREFFGSTFQVVEEVTDLRRGKRHLFFLLKSESVSSLVEAFNQMPANEALAIFGTRKSSEGISLMRVENIHILTPEWNFPPLFQAIGRGIRAGSHAGLSNPLVRIFLHCVLPRGKVHESIHMHQYLACQTKEKNIMLFLYFMKVQSWDCVWNRSRNTPPEHAHDGSRECQYQECDYPCFPFSSPSVESGVVHAEEVFEWDTSTFEAYYAPQLRWQEAETWKKTLESNTVSSSPLFSSHQWPTDNVATSFVQRFPVLSDHLHRPRFSYGPHLFAESFLLNPWMLSPNPTVQCAPILDASGSYVPLSSGSLVPFVDQQLHTQYRSILFSFRWMLDHADLFPITLFETVLRKIPPMIGISIMETACFLQHAPPIAKYSFPIGIWKVMMTAELMSFYHIKTLPDQKGYQHDFIPSQVRRLSLQEKEISPGVTTTVVVLPGWVLVSGEGNTKPILSTKKTSSPSNAPSSPVHDSPLRALESNNIYGYYGILTPSSFKIRDVRNYENMVVCQDDPKKRTKGKEYTSFERIDLMYMFLRLYYMLHPPSLSSSETWPVWVSDAHWPGKDEHIAQLHRQCPTDAAVCEKIMAEKEYKNLQTKFFEKRDQEDTPFPEGIQHRCYDIYLLRKIARKDMKGLLEPLFRQANILVE